MDVEPLWCGLALSWRQVSCDLNAGKWHRFAFAWRNLWPLFITRKSDFLPTLDETSSHLPHSQVTKDLDLQPLPCKMAMTYHPQSMYQSLKKSSSASGFVRMSAFCLVVQQEEIRVALLLTWEQNWWYLSTMCLVLGVNLWEVAIMIHNWVSSWTLQMKVGVFTWTRKNLLIYLRRVISGMMSWRAWESAIYSALAILKAISVWRWLTQWMGQFAYIMT